MKTLTITKLFSHRTRHKTITYRTADELPWLIYRIQDKDKLQECLLDLDLFLKLYKRLVNLRISNWLRSFVKQL